MNQSKDLGIEYKLKKKDEESIDKWLNRRKRVRNIEELDNDSDNNNNNNNNNNNKSPPPKRLKPNEKEDEKGEVEPVKKTKKFTWTETKRVKAFKLCIKRDILGVQVLYRVEVLKEIVGQLVEVYGDEFSGLTTDKLTTEFYSKKREVVRKLVEEREAELIAGAESISSLVPYIKKRDIPNGVVSSGASDSYVLCLSF